MYYYILGQFQLKAKANNKLLDNYSKFLCCNTVEKMLPSTKYEFIIYKSIYNCTDNTKKNIERLQMELDISENKIRLLQTDIK